LRETKQFLEKYPRIEKIVFVCFGDRAFSVYQDIFERVF